jgi:hypothetical protein
MAASALDHKAKATAAVLVALRSLERDASGQCHDPGGCWDHAS